MSDPQSSPDEMDLDALFARHRQDREAAAEVASRERAARSRAKTDHRLRNGLIIAVAPLLGILLWIGLNLSPNSVSPPTSPVSQETTEVDGDVGDNPVDAVVAIDFTAPVQDQTLTIREMDDISSPAEWATVSYADRVAYAIARNPSNFPVSELNNDFLVERPDMLPSYVLQGVPSAAATNSNPLEAAKTFTAGVYYTTGSNYETAFNEFAQASGDVRFDKIYVHTDNGNWQSGKDANGQPIDFINVTYNIGSQTSDEISGERTTQVIRTEVRLLDGSPVVAYAGGRGIDGHNAPDSAYPY